MGSYQVTLGANTVSAFTIPGPCYRFQVTQIAGAATTYVTGDGTGPAFPASGTINTGDGSNRQGGVGETQRVVPATTGVPVVIQGLQPGSSLASSGGSSLTQVQMLSAGSPTLLVEW